MKVTTNDFVGGDANDVLDALRYSTSGTSVYSGITSGITSGGTSYITGTITGNPFPYHNWYAKTAITDHANPDPPKPTKFWECEYCGCVTPVDSLDCRKCGHSATKKAMQAAFEIEKQYDKEPIIHAFVKTPDPNAGQLGADVNEDFGPWRSYKSRAEFDSADKLFLTNWRTGL